MNWKILLATCVIAALPSLALAAPPTKAEVVKVVQEISADKAKVKTYCDLRNLIQESADEEDEAKRRELDNRIQALTQKLGPNYAKLMEALDEVDPDSPEGKDLLSAFEPLDRMCTG